MTGNNEPSNRILHVFRHGCGDAVMFTAVLAHLKKHRPDWSSEVASLKGKHSAYFGLVARSYQKDQEPPHREYGQVIDYVWPECWSSWPDSPGTKTALCLRQQFGITPEWDLLRYVVLVGPAAKDRVEAYVKTLPDRPFVLIHYEGNTSKSEKDLPHQVVRETCDWLIAKGYTPVILDWDRRSPIPNQETVFCPDVNDPLWMNSDTGDVETMAALIERSALFVGIDSGPLHVACATATPTLACWVGHHPYHYCDNAPNVVHLLPASHETFLRGNKRAALEFFGSHYRYETYPAAHLGDLIRQQAAKVFRLPYNPMAAPDLLTATSFGEEYYLQHKEAGLDYLAHGEWQEKYGRWFVDALGLRGKTLLDVGCACGSIGAGLAKAGALVSGCDVNEYMIRLGRERWLADRLFVCDATNLHYWRDNTFSIIHSAQVFEHFKPDLVPHILKEIWRVTRDGGILFAALDTAEMYARQGRDLAREDATHACVRPLAWWYEQLAHAGWQLAPDLLEPLRLHPDTYFARYDWDAFCCRKEA